MRRISPDHLRDKALLALEDACQECRYRTPRRGVLLRFCLAYLWSASRCDRATFDKFWKAMAAPHSPWSHSVADNALLGIYRALDVDRPEHVHWRMWARWQAEERAAGRISSPQGEPENRT